MVLLWLGIEPKTRTDLERLSHGLQVLMDRDPSVAVRARPSDGAAMIGGTSETHLEMVIDRLAREFQVEARILSLDIAYKEACTVAASGEMKYARQSGGRGHYAHVKIRVRPLEPGSGVVFENEIVGGAIPSPFIAPIRQGVDEAIAGGVLAGYPIDDVHVTLYDGSYHDVDSSAAAFKIAAAVAFQDAARKAGPILLEPKMNVAVTSSMDDEDAVLRSLAARSVFIHFNVVQGNARIIAGQAPLSALLGYESALQRCTNGRGTVSMSFSHYAPAALADDDGDRDTPVREPKHPRRPPLILRASVPEPRDYPPTASPRSRFLDP